MDINTINNYLLPLVLFLVYLSIAAQFIPPTSTDNITELSIGSALIAPTSKEPAIALREPKLSREDLIAMNLKDIKQLCTELQIVPEGNRSKKQTWIDAIVAIG